MVASEVDPPILLGPLRSFDSEAHERRLGKSIRPLPPQAMDEMRHGALMFRSVIHYSQPPPWASGGFGVRQELLPRLGSQRLLSTAEPEHTAPLRTSEGWGASR